MVKRPGELDNDETTDAIARAAGAGSERFDGGDHGVDTDNAMLSAFETETDDTEHIKAQIEETRNNLGETIDAIQEKLSFANMSEQVSEQVSNVIETAKDSLYDATFGKAVYFMKNLGEEISGTKVVKTVQNNPFPVLLIGLGAGLLAYQSYSKTKRPIRGLRNFEPAGSSKTSLTGRAYEGVSGAADAAATSVSNAAGSAYSSVSDAAGSAYGTVSEKASAAYAGAGEAVSKAYNAAGEYGTMAQEKYEYYIEENPLAVGAVAAALGAAVGLAFPSTRYEGELMGEARQNLLDKAQNAAGDLVEKAKQVAGEAGQTIKEEARALAQ